MINYRLRGTYETRSSAPGRRPSRECDERSAGKDRPALLGSEDGCDSGDQLHALIAVLAPFTLRRSRSYGSRTPADRRSYGQDHVRRLNATVPRQAPLVEREVGSQEPVDGAHRREWEAR